MDSCTFVVSGARVRIWQINTYTQNGPYFSASRACDAGCKIAVRECDDVGTSHLPELK